MSITEPGQKPKLSDVIVSDCYNTGASGKTRRARLGRREIHVPSCHNNVEHEGEKYTPHNTLNVVRTILSMEEQTLVIGAPHWSVKQQVAFGFTVSLINNLVISEADRLLEVPQR